MSPIADYALAAAASTSLELEPRRAALHLCACLVGTRRRAVVKQKLLPAMLARLFEACLV